MNDRTNDPGRRSTSQQTGGNRPTSGAESTAQEAQRRAQQTIGQAQQTAERAADKAKDTAQRAAGRVQEQAGPMVEQAEERTKGMLDAQKNRAAGELGGVAEALHTTADQLRQKDRGAVAEYADRAASSIESFSGQLRNKSVDELLNDARNVARRNPQLFLGGAFALGVFVSRFLKASSPEPEGMGAGLPMRREDMTGTYLASRTASRPYATGHTEPAMSRRTSGEVS